MLSNGLLLLTPIKGLGEVDKEIKWGFLSIE